MNCNIHLISVALPLCFSPQQAACKNLGVHPVQWAQHKQKIFAVSLYPHQRPGAVLKRSLWRYTHFHWWERQNGCFLDKQRLLLGSLVMLALCGMVLLLLWNYQCFIVNHTCQDPEHSPEHVLFDKDQQRLFFIWTSLKLWCWIKLLMKDCSKGHTETGGGLGTGFIKCTVPYIYFCAVNLIFNLT